MPPRGRKPTPTALKLVKGEVPSRINHDEPQAEEGIPVCPVPDKMVRDVWDYTVDALRKMKVVTMADRDMLLAYCQAVVMHRRASEVLDRTGYLIEATDGMFPNPAVRMQRDAAAMMKAFGTEFGLTPSSRSRIRVGDQKPAEGAGPARLLSS